MREDFFKELQFLAAQPALKNAVESRAAFRLASSLTEDELCRQAILRLGTMEQLGSSSHALLLAKSLYPQVRDALLLTGSWTWAMKSTTVIETIPRPEYKWAYRYAVPSDCLRVFRVNDWDASAADSAWEVLGNCIYTNADSGSPAWTVDRVYEVGNAVSNKGAVYRCMVAGTVKEPGVTTGWQSDWDVWLGSAITLEYVRKVTDVTFFDSLFIDLLTANLAAKLSVPLTGDANKAALLVKETEGLFKSPAMRRDSTERKPKIKPAWMSSKLVSSRNGGDGIDASQASGGGPAGGVSYPALHVTLGSVRTVTGTELPFVTNTGVNDTAVFNFGLPQAGVIDSFKNTLYGNGVAKTFTITGLKSSDPNHVIVSINGVVQEPTIDYLVNQGAGTITFSSAIPNGAKVVVVVLGLYSSSQRSPDLYVHSFATNTAGTFNYYGMLLNADVPVTGSPAAVSKWTITRTAVSSAGAITSSAVATNVAWNNRETATYA